MAHISNFHSVNSLKARPGLQGSVAVSDPDANIFIQLSHAEALQLATSLQNAVAEAGSVKGDAD